MSAHRDAIDRPSRWALFTALSPLALWVVLILLVPGFTDPLYQNPPGILGLPAGIVIAAVAAILTVIGVLVVWRSHSSSVSAIAIACLTIPALLLIGLAPAIVLAAGNLSG